MMASSVHSSAVENRSAAGASRAAGRSAPQFPDIAPIKFMGANMLDSSPILIVSGERDRRARLAAHVFKFGMRPVCCETVADARALVGCQPFSAALSEDQLPDGDYREVITEMRRLSANFPVVVISRRDDWDFYLSTVRMGAFDSVAFPPTPGELERVLWTALSEAKRS